MASEFLKLNSKDFVRGLAVAVGAAVFSQLASWFNVPGFDIATADWSELIRIGVGAAIGYLSKNLLTDDRGRLFGKI